MKYKRTFADKLNTLLFGKDLRITKGERYKEEREFDYSSYYPVSEYIFPVDTPEENTCNIADFGASPDKNAAENARAINECIDFCSKNGKTTVIIDGGTYTCGTVILKSGVNLFIKKGSGIIADENAESISNMALLYAENCSDISVTGGGEINGNGHLFGRKPLYDKNVTSDCDCIDVIEMRKVYRAQLRFAHESKYGRLVHFKNCKNVNINNIVLADSPSWTLRLTKCDNVNIENLVINDNRHVANTDGIDLMQSSHVKIRHCFISCADDGIVLKNAVWEGCDGEMNDIHVSDCEVISCTNAFKIGTETTYPIKNVTVENCRFFMTDLYPGSVSGISIESADGSRVSDVKISNIEMDRCTCPLFIRLCNRNRASKVNSQSASAVEFSKKPVGKGSADKKLFDMTGEIENIRIKNIRATGVELPVIITGFRQKGKTKRVKNICLENFDLTYSDKKEVIDRRLFIPEYPKEYPECWRFRNLPSYALWVRHAQNLNIRNFSCSPAPDAHRKKEIFKDVK